MNSETECNYSKDKILGVLQICKQIETAKLVDVGCDKCVGGVKPILIAPTGEYVWILEWNWIVIAVVIFVVILVLVLLK